MVGLCTLQPAAVSELAEGDGDGDVLLMHCLARSASGGIPSRAAGPLARSHYLGYSGGLAD